MKIVRIIARLNVGGPARHVVWLSHALQDGEFDSVLIAGKVPAGEENMGYFADEHNVQPIFIEEMSRELSSKDVVSLWKVYKQLKRNSPDIIHTHTAKAGTIGRFAGFLYRWFTPKTLIGSPRKVKIVHTFHGHVFHSYYGNFKTNVFLFIERMLARFATHKIIVISEQQRKEINEKFRVGKKEQFEVIPLGLDLEPFGDWRAKREVSRREIEADEDTILIGLVGRLTEVKNHQMFLDVAKNCVASKNLDTTKVKFVVIGDGHLRKNLETKTEEMGLKDAVIFLGNQTDPDVFYSGLDIVALTSLNEGTPLSLIEAMACEKPVVSTNVGGVSDLLGEVVDDRGAFVIHERGIAAESNDVEGFHAGLSHMIETETLRLKFMNRGKAFVNEHYSKARLIKDVKTLYRTISDS